MLLFVMCISIILMLASCGGDAEKTEKKEEAPKIISTATNKTLSDEEKKALDAEVKAYKAEINENASNTEASIALSDVFVKYEQFHDALTVLTKAISNTSADTMLYDKLMSVYKASGSTVHALSYIDTIADNTIRRKYIDEAYDRRSENALVMGNTLGNLTTEGMMLFDDGVIYYCDIARYNNLYRIKDGVEELLVDGNISYLNLVGEHIYFVDKNDYFIYKIDKNGEGRTKVSDTMATNLIILGNKMYFINWMDNCKVYCMNLDGSEQTLVSEISTELLYAYGNRLYVTDRENHNELYSVSLVDGSSYMLPASDVYFVTGYDHMIYYRAGGKGLNISCMTVDGVEYEPINNTRSGYINADKGYVYFTAFEEGALYKAKADGTELIKLCDDDPAYTSIDGDYLYYFNGFDNEKLYRIRKDGTGRECLN